MSCVSQERGQSTQNMRFMLNVGNKWMVLLAPFLLIFSSYHVLQNRTSLRYCPSSFLP